MRQILQTEEDVQIPPLLRADPFYRITYLLKEKIRNHKWIEGEKGRELSWEEARQEWTDAHRERYETHLFETLSFPCERPFGVKNTSPNSSTANILVNLPHRFGG